MNYSFLLVVLLSLSTCSYCKQSSKKLKKLAAEKVVTLGASDSPQMLAYTSSSSYPALNDLKAWSNYHKESGRLDSILNKCYECIRDRNAKDDQNYKRPLKINPALNTFTEPRYTDTDFGSLAWNLNGPVVHSGGLFVSSSVGQNRGVSRSYTSGYNTGYGSGYGGSNVGSDGGINGGGINKITTSLSCMVGVFGKNAYATACEYGQSYCQTIAVNNAANLQTETFVGVCLPICMPLTFTTCFTGTLSNKQGPICLSGNLKTSAFAVPIACAPTDQCSYDTDVGDVNCAPADSCPKTGTTICSESDYPFESVSLTAPRGPLCYIGVFGSTIPTTGIPIGGTQFPRGLNAGAVLVACANKFVCQTSIDSTTGAATGSCVSDASCINSTSITCTRLDYANKQGPLCYVGNFGSNAQPIACAKGQVCQRTSFLTPFGTTISTGSCATKCIPSAYTYCCKGDLCNSYDTTLNHKKCDANSDSKAASY